MTHPDSRHLPLSRIVRIGIFAALAFGINAPFLVIPNIELFSLALFLSGVFLGAADGAAVGIVAGLIFVLFNPNGLQTIPLVGLAQILGFVSFGLCGGLLRRAVLRRAESGNSSALLIISGALLTLWYDLITNLAFALLFGPFWVVLIGGIGFGLIHFISNSIIFGMSSLVIGKIWRRIEHLMPPSVG